MSPEPREPEMMRRNLVDAAKALRALSDEPSRRILCKLVELGEAEGWRLAEELQWPPEALSRQLARLRCAGFLASRRDGRRIWRRIADARLESFLASLFPLCCKGLSREPS